MPLQGLTDDELKTWRKCENVALLGLVLFLLLPLPSPFSREYASIAKYLVLLITAFFAFTTRRHQLHYHQLSTLAWEANATRLAALMRLIGDFKTYGEAAFLTGLIVSVFLSAMNERGTFVQAIEALLTTSLAVVALTWIVAVVAHLNLIVQLQWLKKRDDFDLHSS